MKNQVDIYTIDDIKFLLNDGPDLINQHLIKGELWETIVIQLLKLFLNKRNQPVFLDIGANLGSITIPIGKYLQSRHGKVISFEPQRAIYYQLCGNIFCNHLTQVCTAHQLAIGNQDIEIDIPILDLEKERNIGALSLDENIRTEQNILSSPITQFEKVKLTRLDSLNLPPIQLIKIDVEGLELDVLQGATQLLRHSNYPPIFFEVWGDYMKNCIPKRIALINFLQDTLGYKLTPLGETYIAQHPSNHFFDISCNNNSIELSSS